VHTAMVISPQADDAAAFAGAFGMGEGRLGEAFRLERSGGLEGLFQSMPEPIPGAKPGSVRPGLEGESHSEESDRREE
jgi:hypothetical protein